MSSAYHACARRKCPRKAYLKENPSKGIGPFVRRLSKNPQKLKPETINRRYDQLVPPPTPGAPRKPRGGSRLSDADKLSRLARAAQDIQRVARGRSGRTTADAMRKLKAAATNIQRVVRGAQSRKQTRSTDINFAPTAGPAFNLRNAGEIDVDALLSGRPSPAKKKKKNPAKKPPIQQFTVNKKKGKTKKPFK